ncbi:hypothetical protein UMM65_04350 [Aureibaculum sp. 2210JD6-5]|uniref:hypothetical protein n=1 Tax=Aureibaculum sp. 2210JD6-5 TaxID=3103957 RepID=UPI002AAEDFB5|nr:hypothetical protein [Aureibaculum sp. 2210JD6-5]MDY7394460.1 hypothetical protein [Aureibaculum sp. 2210JD6-5]
MISAQELYQQTKHKTRVIILASKANNNITAMLLHILKYHDKSVDYVLPNGKSHIAENNEFILIEVAKNANELKGNIALISDVNPEIQTVKFVNSITNGGMLVYNEDVPAIKLIVEASTNPIKKYPYLSPNFTLEDDIYFLDTNEGKLPLEITNENDIKNMLGIKWICQHMGVDEDDFYEAVGTLRFNHK